MLDSVGRVLETDEDCDHEVLAAGGQCAERIFHVGTAGLVDYLEITWSIGPEEGLEKLACLVAAAVTGTGEDSDLQIVSEPCGKLVGIAIRQVFGYGHKHLIPSVLGRSVTAQKCQSCRSKHCKHPKSHIHVISARQRYSKFRTTQQLCTQIYTAGFLQ